MYAHNEPTDRTDRIADGIDPSPSTSFDAVADALHAPDAHAVSEYHEPPADRADLETMLRNTSLPPEVAL